MRLLLFLMISMALVASARGQSGGVAYLLDIKGAIGPATSDYVHRGLEKARADRADLVILRIDTPGGLDTSMREIVQDISSSTVPVVSYVAPSGARAASAGTVIVYASHIAAMAPGTNIGAATPVVLGMPGSPATAPGDNKGATGGSGKPEVGMHEKMVNDAAAYIRSLANMRGRNADWAEKAVREAASLPAEQALKEGVIDLVAPTLDNLLARINGRTVTVAGTERTLHTVALRIVPIEPDWRVEFLGILTNPNVAYILMLAGIFGLGLEFFNPGTFLPGVTGAICLLLALYAFQLLPVNYAGLGLVVLGVALMVSEAFVTSFGALGFGGVAAFVIGSVMLLDTSVPGYRISWMLIGSIALVSAGMFLFMMTMMMRARRRAVVTGKEQMIGGLGQVIDWKGGRGHVRIHGEIWKARSAAPLASGSSVKVDDLDGLTLVVTPEGQNKEPTP